MNSSWYIVSEFQKYVEPAESRSKANDATHTTLTTMEKLICR